MERYVCIHGHFYQPPRENPWLETIELQDSAYPYHDWNERITAEAYGPNARSRILDGEDRIVEIANNYSRMSYNYGPTLLAWMEWAEPEVYEAVLAADSQSATRFGGHGSAMAQAYNHVIMPLANSRDKHTQVLWGIRDFEYRFGRLPEGMWLPETAVDMETLDIMTRLGIKYTILEPGQASRVRRIGGRAWKDVSGGQIDPTRAYTIRLKAGRRISAFFYDGPISRAVAFEGLLTSGEQFAGRIADGFHDDRSWSELVHIATDGESYGHHHRHGDMALASALSHIEDNGMARLTNYGEYLEKYPPAHEAEVFENTSWSCAHGVERWQSDCGCNSGGNPGWNQAWRRTLRDALDWLRDEVIPRYEERARKLFKDPWQARNAYINVVLDRSPQGIEHYLAQQARHDLNDEETVTALKLLELQRHAMLMYTSCGWFFDEISGIEATQVIQYAGRVIQLAQDLFGDGLEEHFVTLLSEAKSNIAENQDGRVIYEKFVRPAIVDLSKVGAHFAVSSLFESYPQETSIFCYDAEVEDSLVQEAGIARLLIGRARLRSEITHESALLTYGVLHFGDHNIIAGVRLFRDDTAYRELVEEASEAFNRADLPDVVRTLDKHFGEATYSLKSLFKDEQRKILNIILESTLSEAEANYRQIFEHHAPLMRFLMDINFPLPGAFRSAAALVVNANLRACLEDGAPDFDRVRSLVEEAGTWEVDLDEVALAYSLEQTLERLATEFADEPERIERLDALATAVSSVAVLPFNVDISDVQNRYYRVLHNVLPVIRARAGEDAEAAAWTEQFLTLGSALAMRVE